MIKKKTANCTGIVIILLLICSTEYRTIWNRDLIESRNEDNAEILSNKYFRRSHIKWYIRFLDKIEILTKDTSRPFQTWIILDSGFGSADAIYFHTENPHSEFPIKFDDFNWSTQENELLKGLIDLNKYDLGRCLY
ncbi:hypothetical protein [Paenibacillus segetis]|uniref:Uncharacterized protein n=1 Tax=Paenibacillus segetis TaxID=1325360 RepID=A0ABQ1YIL0_9BACL|nr:hypothetical protein [Paenibacillus segetis]GGH27607.1 hypothetical protein GCM10008013_29180 [Paenibacillus segetis]